MDNGQRLMVNGVWPSPDQVQYRAGAVSGAFPGGRIRGEIRKNGDFHFHKKPSDETIHETNGKRRAC